MMASVNWIRLCPLLADAKKHIGEAVLVQGTIVQYEHGIYLFANPRCQHEPSGIIIQGELQGYREAGGTKGVGVSATVEGVFVMSKLGVPKYIKAPYLAFLAKRVHYELTRKISK
jgi:hypothetical protein